MKTKVAALLLVLVLTVPGFGQSDDLKVYGFFQNYMNHYSLKLTTPKVEKDYTSFVLQQMNLIFAKNFGPKYSAFINFEYTNSFSFSDNLGTFKIEEAWFKYSMSNAFNVKAGLLVPRFNNLNEIKNRTALLPYIYRPIIYETAFAGQFSTDEFVPTQAYIQVYGETNISDLKINYAVFGGNSDKKNLVRNDQLVNVAHDTTKFKMVGGRVGIEYGSLQAGVSGSYDRKGLWAYGIGHIPRVRIGAYLNYSAFGFDLEGEYIHVAHTITDRNKSILSNLKTTAPATPQAFDKTFCYANLLYNFTDDLFGYAGYSYVESDDNFYSIGGTDVISAGAGYRLNDAITLKAQYMGMKYPIGTRKTYLLGASVYF